MSRKLKEGEIEVYDSQENYQNIRKGEKCPACGCNTFREIGVSSEEVECMNCMEEVCR
jgi:hypothetical protein